MHPGQLPLNIDTQQLPRLAPTETVGEQSEKRHKLPAQPGNF